MAKKTDSQQIDLGLLPTLLGYRLRLAQLAVFADFVVSTGSAQMTPSLFGALVVIEANPGLKQTDLARAVRLDRSTVVSVLDTLEKRQLVIRKRGLTDRRSNALELTATGKQLLAELLPRIEDHEQRLVQNLSASEQTTLAQLLGKIFPAD